MADILIRGMEMPKTCCQCDLKIYNPEKRWVENGIEQIGAWVCKRTREIIWNTQRGENCPLLPLPEGHGRLGDLDALLESMRESYQKAQEWRDNSTGEIYVRADATVMAFLEFGNRTKNAPTIAPADVTDIDVGNKKEGGGVE